MAEIDDTLLDALAKEVRNMTGTARFLAAENERLTAEVKRLTRMHEAAVRDQADLRAEVERLTAEVERLPERSAFIDAAYLDRQRTWSRATFGPGRRTDGILAHIVKEVEEVRAAPTDLSEWADLVILALDGAWRAGHEPQAILDAIAAKQATNEARTWTDWRTASEGEAIEHVRDKGTALMAGFDDTLLDRAIRLFDGLTQEARNMAAVAQLLYAEVNRLQAWHRDFGHGSDACPADDWVVCLIDHAERLTAQRQAVLDLFDAEASRTFGGGARYFSESSIREALGVTG